MQGEDDGCSLLATAGYVAAREGEKPVGVYALYDDKRNLQYVGYARNVVLAVKVRAARRLRECVRVKRDGRCWRWWRCVGGGVGSLALCRAPRPPLACDRARRGEAVRPLPRPPARAGAPGARGGGAVRLGARHGVCQQGDAVAGGAAARGRQLAGGGGHAAARWAVGVAWQQGVRGGAAGRGARQR